MRRPTDRRGHLHGDCHLCGGFTRWGVLRADGLVCGGCESLRPEMVVQPIVRNGRSVALGGATANRGTKVDHRGTPTPKRKAGTGKPKGGKRG
jgi:hypothetical protein